MTDTVEVTETFVSLQGESTYAGLPCYFVRLAGCNLRCRYCDTPRAWSPGRRVAVEALVRECLDAHTAVAEITGGEPLLQPGFGTLAESLRDRTGRPVLVETNGSQDLSLVPDGVVAVMDIKCPGSGETAAMAWDNLGRLRRCDEVKFVLTDRADFDWACDLVERERLEARCAAVLFSAAAGCLDPALLAGWIIERRPPVRLQVQWHRVLGIP